MYVGKIRVYSKEVGEFKKLERCWKSDPRAGVHVHIRNFTDLILTYKERFEQEPTLEIRKIMLARSIEKANKDIYEWVSNNVHTQ